MRMSDEHERLVRMLKESISLMCKSSLSYDVELNVEGLLGITLDKKDIFLVNINESFQTEVEKPLDTELVSPKSSNKQSGRSKRGHSDLVEVKGEGEVNSPSPRKRRARRRSRDSTDFSSTQHENILGDFELPEFSAADRSSHASFPNTDTAASLGSDQVSNVTDHHTTVQSEAAVSQGLTQYEGSAGQSRKSPHKDPSADHLDFGSIVIKQEVGEVGDDVDDDDDITFTGESFVDQSNFQMSGPNAGGGSIEAAHLPPGFPGTSASADGSQPGPAIALSAFGDTWKEVTSRPSNSQQSPNKEQDPDENVNHVEEQKSAEVNSEVAVNDSLSEIERCSTADGSAVKPALCEKKSFDSPPPDSKLQAAEKSSTESSLELAEEEVVALKDSDLEKCPDESVSEDDTAKDSLSNEAVHSETTSREMISPESCEAEVESSLPESQAEVASSSEECQPDDLQIAARSNTDLKDANTAATAPEPAATRVDTSQTAIVDAAVKETCAIEKTNPRVSELDDELTRDNSVNETCAIEKTKPRASELAKDNAIKETCAIDKTQPRVSEIGSELAKDKLVKEMCSIEKTKPRGSELGDELMEAAPMSIADAMAMSLEPGTELFGRDESQGSNLLPTGFPAWTFLQNIPMQSVAGPTSPQVGQQPGKIESNISAEEVSASPSQPKIKKEKSEGVYSGKPNQYNTSTNTQGEFKCLYCPQIFTNRDVKNVHMNKNHGHELYRCDICGVTFHRIMSLKRHHSIHDNKRPTFECEKCHRVFLRKDTVRVHQRTNCTSAIKIE